MNRKEKKMSLHKQANSDKYKPTCKTKSAKYMISRSLFNVMTLIYFEFSLLK